MTEASRVVLDGFEIRVGVEPIRYPDHYKDSRGTKMLDKVLEIIDLLEGEKNAHAAE